MYSILLHIHSGLRWFVLVFLVWAIIRAAMKSYRKEGKPLAALLGLISTHVQLVIGLILYFISPKVIFAGSSMSNSVLRFYLVEHIALMLAAVILITMGYVKAKRAAEDLKMNKSILWYYSIGLLLILVSIPWPFRNLGAGWF
ncbi:MAG: hypothetical protein R6W71_01455 [Bacteroidales bacterium]